ncbi:hypothetical protein SAMN05216428_101583 [Nitrosospira sp. Nsp11]|nr:hypothetical protein SAMN05216428_101583 [Nitrosospira sp. Nsp11]
MKGNVSEPTRLDSRQPSLALMSTTAYPLGTT